MGIKSTGDVMTRIIAEHGWCVYDYSEYPSLIRGGHNTYHVRAGTSAVRSTVRSAQILVALNEDTVRLDFPVVAAGGAILYDSDELDPDTVAAHRDDVHYIGLPLRALAVESGGSAVYFDTVAIGASLAALAGSIDIAERVVARHFSSKGKSVAESNAAAARRGFAYVRERWPNVLGSELTVQDAPKRIVIAGNEALGIGAIAGGLQFFAAYPMTPATSLLQYLARVGPDHGVVVKHAEDEIGAVNMAIGGAYAGLRTMTGTSGGGFSLMVESLGLAAMTETPLVIVNAQRPGPATGLPTWTEQSDLRFIVHAAQGEFPRIVLAPGNASECFTLGAEALNYAERFQLPVIILTDKLLAESQESVEPFSTKHLTIDRGKRITLAAAKKLSSYSRYAVAADGISPQAVPGLPNTMFLANSDEHDEQGFSDESAGNRQRMVEKRASKLTTAADELPQPMLHGPPEAEVTFVGWGSTMGAVLDAMDILARRGVRANFLRFVVLWPFPAEYAEAVLKRSSLTILVENNSQGQLGGLIREMIGEELNFHILKYDGRPFVPGEIAEQVLELVT